VATFPRVIIWPDPVIADCFLIFFLIGKVGSAISTDHRQNGRVDLKGSIHANPRKFFKNTQ
jgi:hypothetical protein